MNENQMKTNSFYGYTNDIKQLRKTKIENTLNKLVRDSKNTIFTYADFVVDKVFNEKCNIPKINTITHGMISGYYGKEYGELAKPKTEYFIHNENGKGYFLNKTCFDFATYIFETFKSLEDIQKFINFEADRVKAEKETEEQRIANEQAEQKAKEQTEKDFKEWLTSEREKLIGTEIHTICGEIFNYYYPEIPCTQMNPSLMDSIVCADSIENPLCRNELILRLHNGNKASIKIFETYTGVKLATTQKQRIVQLETITKNDYKGMQEFKPRKKSERTEKEIETYYRRIKDEYVKVQGESIKIDGIIFFIGKNEKGYYIATEATTGLGCIDFQKNKSLAKDTLKNVMKIKKDMILKGIQRAYDNGIKSPLYSA